MLDLPAEPLAVAADREKLRQIVTDLVDNAVKYSPEGGTVRVAARRRDDTVEVSVDDEGIGIPEAEQSRIFAKFYRAESAGRDLSSGGTGLGLFIAKELLAAMRRPDLGPLRARATARASCSRCPSPPGPS